MWKYCFWWRSLKRALYSPGRVQAWGSIATFIRHTTWASKVYTTYSGSTSRKRAIISKKPASSRWILIGIWMRIIEVNPDSLTPVHCHRSNQQWRVLGRRAGTRQILMSFIKGVGQNKMWKFISKHLETLLLSIKVGQSVLRQSAGKHHADISSGLAELTSRSPLSLHLTHSASQSIRFFSINDGATASKYSW